MKNKIMVISLSLFSLFMINIASIKAFQLWGGGISNPLKVTIARDVSLQPYSATTYYTQWTNYCSINFALSAGLSSDIVMGASTGDNGTYVTTYKAG